LPNTLFSDFVQLPIADGDIIDFYLVGGLEHEFYFPYIGNVIIPTDSHIFQRGRSTTNQILRSLTINIPFS
jgi:hypothetical protein